MTWRAVIIRLSSRFRVNIEARIEPPSVWLRS